MKKLWSLMLAVTLACASAQKTEFKTVTAATDAVESARSAYQTLYRGCQANPTSTSLCPGIVSSHYLLATAYVKYQGGVKALADANIAALAIGADPSADQKVAAAVAGLIQLAGDFVALESSVTSGGK